MKYCDAEKWAMGRVPIVLRRAKVCALVSVLVAQVGRLLTQGARYGEEVRYRLAHTSQVCSLRAMLNDKLDADARRVDIVDAEPKSEPFVVYYRSANKPVMIGDGVYRLAPPRGYDAEKEINFVVRVPKEWRGTEKEGRLTALVNRGKLASMRYRVEYTI